MARLSSPLPPLLGVDAMVFVYHFEANPVFGEAAGRVLQATEDGRLSLVTSILSLMEVLVVPKRNAATALARRYRDFFGGFPNLTMVEIGTEVVEVASDLRARFRVRTPDALHIATAMVARAEGFISEDGRLPAGLPIPLLRLADVAA